MDAAAYLRRIGFESEIRHDAATLEALQRAHMTAVPFENLHVFHRRGVRTDPAWSVPKVLGGRGGWCFELNGAFSALLDSLGFNVTRLGAEVLLPGAPPAELDHLTIRVDLAEPYLVDVGFGDSFIRPLRLVIEDEQDGGTMPFRLRREGSRRILESKTGTGWTPEYRFDLTAHPPEDFVPRSQYLQTTSELRWTQAPFATRLLDGGPDRVWLLHDRLKVRRNGITTETPVPPVDWPAVLSEWFGMDDRRARDEPPTRVVAIVDHEPPSRAPLRLQVGETVTVGERDTEWPEFVFVTIPAGGEGWVPARYLSSDAGRATMTAAYDTTELPTSTGEHLTVLQRDDDSGWLWCVNQAGREGWVPSRSLLPSESASLP